MPFDFLKSLRDFAQDSSVTYNEKTFDLRSFRRFLDAAEIQAPTTSIIISGSKGKGSTAELLRLILEKHGKRVGLFTSPYLFDPGEMIRLGSQPISKKDFTGLIVKLQKTYRSFPKITFFEMMTALAFAYFHTLENEKRPDIVILEVGMGGRLDATNVFDPTLSILTPIELEHMSILGKTLKAITHEKMGITRPGIPLVIGKQTAHVRRFIREEAKSNEVPLHESHDMFRMKNVKLESSGTTFQLEIPCNPDVSFQIDVSRQIDVSFQSNVPVHEPLDVLLNAPLSVPLDAPLSVPLKVPKKITVFLPLRGIHFAENFLLALSAARFLLPKIDFSVLHDFNCILPGRIEIAHIHGVPMVFDVCHTPGSAKALRLSLESIYPKKHFIFLLSFLRDKNAAGIVKELARKGDHVIFVPLSHPRAADMFSLYAFFIQNKLFSGISFSYEPRLKKAIERIISLSSQMFLPCISGSNFLLREAKNTISIL